MPFVFDADVLSTFAKIKQLKLLEKVFGKKELLIPPAVLVDLQRSRLPLAKDVLASNLFQQLKIGRQESDLAEKIYYQKILGMGECECIAVCKIRNSAFVTNDKKASNFAEKLNINIIDLETILRFLKDVIGREQLTKIVNDIETKDKVVIVNKKEILQ